LPTRYLPESHNLNIPPLKYLRPQII